MNKHRFFLTIARSSIVLSRKRAAIVTLAILLIASTSHRAHAFCGRQFPPLSSGAEQSATATSTQRNDALHVLPSAGRHEPIVGLWQITLKDSGGNIIDQIISGWTGDGLEFDQDLSPILTGYVCYGTWVKVGHDTYGLTHPFFDFQDVNSNGEGTEATAGQFDGTSGFFDYTVTVSKDGNTLIGRENYTIVQGLNPYDPMAKVLFTAVGSTLTATKVAVNLSQLP
jgi:hypothetical protein